MPRRKLTPKEKGAMQAARKVAKEQSDAALASIGSNAQFKNPKLWAKVDGESVTAIQKAMAKAGADSKRAKIVKLQKELARLESD